MRDIDLCTKCEGSGKDKKFPQNACPACKGRGITVKVSPVPDRP